MNKTVDGHKFRIGQGVRLTLGFGYARTGPSAFTVVALLPSNGAFYQYRIRSSEEQFERVAAENELSPSAA